MVGGNLCLPWSITRVAWVVVVGVRAVLVLKVLVGVPHRAGPVPVGRVGHALIEGVPGGRCWGWVVSSKQPAESESISNELPVEVVEVVRPEGVQLRLQVGRGVVGAVVVRH